MEETSSTRASARPLAPEWTYAAAVLVLAALAAAFAGGLSGCAVGPSSDAAEAIDGADGGPDAEADSGPAAIPDAPYDNGYINTPDSPTKPDTGTASKPDTGTTSGSGDSAAPDSALVDTGTTVDSATVDTSVPDTAPACPSGETLCGATCTDLSSDSSNCGVCGNACQSGQSCTGGVCACPADDTVCSGSCTNVEYDRANCGTCGVTCAASGYCENGRCCAGSVGTCTHPLCAVGFPLAVGCDNSTCTAVVCNDMPSCCTGMWDASCVAAAKAACHLTCAGGC